MVVHGLLASLPAKAGLDERRPANTCNRAASVTIAAGTNPVAYTLQNELPNSYQRIERLSRLATKELGCICAPTILKPMQAEKAAGTEKYFAWRSNETWGQA
jgi:hypothetical protein